MGTSCGLPLGRTVANRAIIGRARNVCSSSFVIDGGVGLAGVGFFSAATMLWPLPRTPTSNKTRTSIFGVRCFPMNNSLLSFSAELTASLQECQTWTTEETAAFASFFSQPDKKED